MPEKLDFLTPTTLKVLEFFFVNQLKVLSKVCRLREFINENREKSKKIVQNPSIVEHSPGLFVLKTS